MTIKSPKVKHLKWSLFNITHSVIIQISHCNGSIENSQLHLKMIDFYKKWPNSSFFVYHQIFGFKVSIFGVQSRFLIRNDQFETFLSRKTTFFAIKKDVDFNQKPGILPQKYFLLKMSFFRNWSLSGWWNLKGNIITMLN